jgi:adenylate cyclase class 2
MMKYEVEIKFRSVDHEQLQGLLEARNAQADSTVVQEDTYLSHPSRDFAETHEAFRLRRIGSENRITYKGPRQTGPTKTREEIEIVFSEGDEAFDQMSRLLAHLGFEPVATIRKSRRTFHLTEQSHKIEVTLDRAQGLGDFAEVEALAANQSDLPAAQAAVLAVAGQLGLTEVENKSYLRMAIEAVPSAADEPRTRHRSN